MKSLALKVNLNEMEKMLRFLKDSNLLINNLRIIKNDGKAFIPVSECPEGYECEYMEFQEIKKIKSYQDLLSLPENLKRILPRSYDRIGDIIVLKLRDELYPYKREIGEALLKFHKGCKTVAIDKGVMGEFRIRDLEVIAGDGLETIHVENGVKIYVDLSKAYFSPRLGGERLRVLRKVGDNEIILDMFAGVGPFSLLLAKFRKVTVYSIDKNIYAIELLKKSMEINHLKNIVPITGDVIDVVPKLGNFDRIIMNFPTKSLDYLDLALSSIKKNGFIHLYTLQENIENTINGIILKNRSIRIHEYGIVHGYSPKENIYYIDIQVV